jgi:serine/threonine protein kinase
LETDPSTGKAIAVKHVFYTADRVGFLRKLEVLATLHHPNVLHIVGWALPHSSHSAQIHIEYAPNGSLGRLLAKIAPSADRPSFWSPTGIGIVICGIVMGMRYVHSCGLIHGDLKPANILLNEKGYPLISGFDSARFISDDGSQAPATGTVRYAAPEQFFEDVRLTPKVDIFSFGLILYEVLVASPVFSSLETPFAVIRRLRARAFPEVPAHCGSLMQDLIGRCWEANPGARPSFHDILCLFQRHQFNILPNADADKIQDFCEAILEWERRSGIPQ